MIWDDWFRLLDKIKINKLISKCCQQIVDNTCTDSMDAVCYDVSSVLHTVCIQVLTFSFHALTNYFWNGKFRVKIFSADQQHWWKQHWIVANFCESCKKKTNYLLFLFKLIQEQTGPTQQVAAILLKDFIKKTWHSEVIFV